MPISRYASFAKKTARHSDTSPLARRLKRPKRPPDTAADGSPNE